MSSLMLVQTNSSELEVELSPVAKPRFPNAGVLIIHPYAGLGGSMNDFVVAELHRQAVASQNFALVMRYNQRGVGRSKGRRFAFKNLRGDQDVADVPHMVEFLSTQLSSPDSSSNARIIVIGYSFGACLAAYALQDPKVAVYIGISFPLGGLTALLQTKKGFDLMCKATNVPRLLVLGSEDQYTKLAAMEEAMAAGGGVRILEEEEEENRNSGGGVCSLAGSPPAVVSLAEQQQQQGDKKPLLLKVFSANTHFWESDSALMVEYCLGWIEQQLS
ncbi:hypothetical protein NADE_008361 [Nannochloris sp. 'desiccata']|nr:hypothetical protein KSW81_000248 [Chlorella desiccata (nom. nud.)]KAH7620086.1 hypothetical protein NADE_008361 [Chlorella desiccata (nom. nud.)]